VKRIFTFNEKVKIENACEAMCRKLQSRRRILCKERFIHLV